MFKQNKWFSVKGYEIFVQSKIISSQNNCQKEMKGNGLIENMRNVRIKKLHLNGKTEKEEEEKK